VCVSGIYQRQVEVAVFAVVVNADGNGGTDGGEGIEESGDKEGIIGWVCLEPSRRG
jgi:hypothetical protein